MANKLPDGSDELTQLLAKGQAGLRLTESLILALVDAKILDKGRALEAIEIVIAGEQEMAAEGHSPEISRAAATLLSSISTSTAAAGASARSKRDRRVKRSS